MTSRQRARCRRLIPACAGKTLDRTREMLDPGAHPRVCGENHYVVSDGRVTQGSSPRVRGKRDASKAPPAPTGLIPACAGKTRDASRFPDPKRAHPRVCGENDKDPYSDKTLSGSSPRVRGKHTGIALLIRIYGLIPACAGKTQRPSPYRPRGPAHPRVCGENSITLRSISSVVGSSPRVRGKLSSVRSLWNVRGLIPACAGKT